MDTTGGSNLGNEELQFILYKAHAGWWDRMDWRGAVGAGGWSGGTFDGAALSMATMLLVQASVTLAPLAPEQPSA